MFSGASDLTTEVLTQPSELAALADAWNELLVDSNENTVFLTWQWLSTWLAVVYPDAKLLTVVVRQRGGRLIGIAPFYLSTLHLVGGLSFDCLRILGDRHSSSEYGNMILRKGYESQAVPLILQTLLDHSSDWHVIWMPKTATWSGTGDLILLACAKMNLILHRRTVHFSMADLGNDYNEWMRRLTHKWRGYLQHTSKKLLAAHEVEHVQPASAEEVPQYLSALFALHRNRWASVGITGSFDRSPFKKLFYEQISQEAYKLGWLQLDALRIDGQIKAVQFGYIYNGALKAVQEGFDPDSANGIGNVLRHRVIERMIGLGLGEYDFLAGFNQHKKHWATRVRLGHDLWIGRNCLRSRLLLAKPFWPTSRLLREGMPE